MPASPPGASGAPSSTGPGTAEGRWRSLPRWMNALGILGIALLILILAAAAWNLAVGNRRLLSGAVGAAAAFGAWRGWRLLRYGPEPDDGYRAPRWVKVSVILAIAFVLLVVGAVAFGIGGDHGPGRHGPGQHGSTTGDAETSGHDGDSPVADGATEIAVTANDLRFDPAEISVRIGTDVAIVLTSADAAHDFTIDQLDAHVSAEEGETDKGGFHAAPPGQYTYYCSVPGHREAGMAGTLIVTGGH